MGSPLNNNVPEGRSVQYNNSYDTAHSIITLMIQKPILTDFSLNTSILFFIEVDFHITHFQIGQDYEKLMAPGIGYNWFQGCKYLAGNQIVGHESWGQNFGELLNSGEMLSSEE